MNKTLAFESQNSIQAGTLEQQDGYCLRACRETAAKVYGTAKYDRLFRGSGRTLEEQKRDATAARAGKRFFDAGLGFYAKDAHKHGGIQPGDMLVKTNVAKNRWGDYSGHIGIVWNDGRRVGENSSTNLHRIHGALGYRSLEEFGSYQIVVRLPDIHAVAASTVKPTPKPTAPPQTPATANPEPYDPQPVKIIVNDLEPVTGLLYGGHLYPLLVEQAESEGQRVTGVLRPDKVGQPWRVKIERKG